MTPVALSTSPFTDSIPPTPPAEIETSPRDRREAVRARPAWHMPIRFGRLEAALVDLSRTGLTVSHSVPAVNREHVRIRIAWGVIPIDIEGYVVSSKVVALGRGSTGTIYETRVRLSGIREETFLRLDRIVAVLTDRDTQSVIMRVLSALAETSGVNLHSQASRPLIRCRLFGGTWEKERVVDQDPPADGFLVPASVTDHSLLEICRLYEEATIDVRSLIRIALGSTVSSSPAQTSPAEDRALDSKPSERFRLDRRAPGNRVGLPDPFSSLQCS